MEENSNAWFKWKIQKNCDISIFLKYVFGFPFLKSDQVENCCTDNIVYILPEDEKDLWLPAFCREAMCSYSINWTMNSCEAFHSKFNSMYYSAHPN